MRLLIRPGYTFIPRHDVDGRPMRGRTIAFRVVLEVEPGHELDLTDAAVFTSENPFVLLPSGKVPVYDAQGRVIGTQADFRLLNHGVGTIRATARGMTATAKVAFGVHGAHPALAPVSGVLPEGVLGAAPTDTGAWLGFTLSVIAFVAGLFSALRQR